MFPLSLGRLFSIMTRFFPPPPLREETKNSNEYYMTLAKKLSERCWQYYEGRSRELNFGTLYCGALGPCCYLRLRFGMLDKTLQKDVTQNKENNYFRLGLRVADTALSQSATRSVRYTLLECRRIGSLSMKVALLSCTNRAEEARKVAQEILQYGQRCQSSAESLGSSECEILYGQSGYLQALLFIRSYLPSQSSEEYLFGRDIAISIIKTILETGISTAAQFSQFEVPLLWEWHETLYLGAAHGVVGILETLLSFIPEIKVIESETKIDYLTLIKQTITKLDVFCFSSGNLRSSPRRETDKLVHWCHGAPGHVLLLVKAYEIFGEEEYLRKAETIAREVIYPRGLLRKGVGLCHGIAGNAYCFLAIHRARQLLEKRDCESNGGKGSDEWMQRAEIFANFAVKKFSELENIPDRPHSLYEGTSGLVMLLIDLCKPENARFPCFEF